MGRKLDGSAPRGRIVAFRLNPDDEKTLDEKMARRGEKEISSYFRSRMYEDE